jgi:4-hydroxy-2-oxoheptanedioate aldolase
LLRSDIVPGGVARTPEQANAMLGRGYKALMLGFDWSLLQRGAASLLDHIRR